MDAQVDFGDAEPEDSWDPDDPPPVLIDNLLRRLALLAIIRERDEHETDQELVDDIADLIDAARDLPDLTDRERLRIRHLVEDVAHIRRKVT